MNTTAPKGGLLKRWYIAGPLLGIVTLAALLFVCAWLLSGGFVPGEIADEVAVAALFLSAFAGGGCSAKRRGRGVLAAGAIAGGSLAALVLLAAACNPEGAALGPANLRALLALTAGGMSGGVLGLKRRTTKKNKKGGSKRRG